MSFGQYIALMISATSVSWFAWYIVLTSVNPNESGILGFIIFYISLCVALIGTLSVLELLIRKSFSQSVVKLTQDVHTSFRHGIILACIIIGSLICTTQGYFYWWTMFIFFIIAGMTEYLSLLIQQTKR